MSKKTFSGLVNGAEDFLFSSVDKSVRESSANYLDTNPPKYFAASANQIVSNFAGKAGLTEQAVEFSGGKVVGIHCTCVNYRALKKTCNHIAALLRLFITRTSDFSAIQSDNQVLVDSLQATVNESSSSSNFFPNLGPISQSIDFGPPERIEETLPLPVSHLKPMIMPSGNTFQTIVSTNTVSEAQSRLSDSNQLRARIAELERENSHLKNELMLKDIQLRAVTERMLNFEKERNGSDHSINSFARPANPDLMHSTETVYPLKADQPLLEHEHTLERPQNRLKRSLEGSSASSIKPYQDISGLEQASSKTPVRPKPSSPRTSPEWLPGQVANAIKSGQMDSPQAKRFNKLISFHNTNDTVETVDADDTITGMIRKATDRQRSRSPQRPALQRSSPVDRQPVERRVSDISMTGSTETVFHRS